MCNPNIFIFHGAYGYPQENWFPWLQQKIIASSRMCYVPAFPTPENQHLEGWFEAFQQNDAYAITSQTILIGHSLGAVFLLRLLERYHIEVKTSILVGAFLGKIGIEKFDSINESFFQQSFDWARIKSRSKQIICYDGNDDPYVSPVMFDFIADQLGAVKVIISQGGHLNLPAGYETFPQLWRQLEPMMR